MEEHLFDVFWLSNSFIDDDKNEWDSLPQYNQVVFVGELIVLHTHTNCYRNKQVQIYNNNNNTSNNSDNMGWKWMRVRW